MQIMDEDSFNLISGNTDSEYIFALFLSLLPDKHDLNVDLKVFAKTVEKTIACILELCDTYSNKQNRPPACSLNLVITDGCHIIATRFRTSNDKSPSRPSTEPPSLYYNWGSNFVCEEGQFFMHSQIGDDRRSPNEIVISSAPLSKGNDLILDTRNAAAAGYPRDMCLDLSCCPDWEEEGDEHLNSSFSAITDSDEEKNVYLGKWGHASNRRKERTNTLDGNDRSDGYQQKASGC